jgi:tRNA(fMet)-specific endonuclease VapC
VRGLLQGLPTLALSPGVAEHYSRVRHELAKLGKPIGVNDMWIAAHALAENRTVVTNNEREYTRVPGLRVENWLR